MQKPHSFFLSAPRPHARQTTRVRERGTVKSVYTIYLPKLSDYTYFHDDIFFFILQVVTSKGVDWCRDASGRAKKVSCHVCGRKKSPWNRASFEFCFCFVFIIIIIIFFYVEPQGRRSVKRVFLLIFCQWHLSRRMLLQLIALTCGLCCIGISSVTANVLRAEVSPSQHNTSHTGKKKKFNFSRVNTLLPFISHNCRLCLLF